MNEEIKNIKWENEVLIQQFKKVEEERNALYNRFLLCIQEIQQKIGLKNLLLEKKTASLREILEAKEAELHQTLSTKMESSVLTTMTKKLEDIIDNGAVVKHDVIQVDKIDTSLLKSPDSNLKYFVSSTESLHGLDVPVTGQKVTQTPKKTPKDKREIDFSWSPADEE